MTAGIDDLSVDCGAEHQSLDSVVEGGDWELTIIASQDQGRNWRFLSKLEKPIYYGLVKSFSFETPKRGCMTLQLDDEGAAVRPGLYEACTKDGGRKWSRFALRR